jgi:lysyl-tRNA synthetase class 2
MNPTVRQTFVMRTRIINTIRRVFNSIGGLEVETPTLQPLYGGALARPFETFHNALGMPMYLRIANELYLKRLIVGGFECVYEICKDFRNEGMDRHHNPEFTMVEIYWAYRDYYDMMDLTERLFLEIARDLHDSSLISYQGRTIDLVPPWARRSMCELVSAAMELDVSRLTADEIRVLLRRVCYDELTDEDPARQQLLSRLPNLLWGEIVAELFSLKCEGDLLNPVFVTDFPKDVSPLAKVHRADSRLTERFELFISGREMANAFSELNDPVDQRERFEAEREKQAHGDREAHPLDEDFLRCMEYGMPPCGGLGIGIDRLVMLFTDQPAIQDVLLFPHLRPDPLLGQADSLHE